MILKLGPLLDVNFKSKAQLHFVHMKGYEIVVTVSWDFLQILGSNSLMIKINGFIYSSFLWIYAIMRTNFQSSIDNRHGYQFWVSMVPGQFSLKMRTIGFQCKIFLKTSGLLITAQH